MIDTLGTVGDGGVEALQEPDVVVGDEHVDEAPQVAVVVEEPVGEARWVWSRRASTSRTLDPPSDTSDWPAARVRSVSGCER